RVAERQPAVGQQPAAGAGGVKQVLTWGHGVAWRSTPAEGQDSSPRPGQKVGSVGTTELRRPNIGRATPHPDPAAWQRVDRDLGSASVVLAGQFPAVSQRRGPGRFAASSTVPICLRSARCVAGGRRGSIESKLRGREAARYFRRPASTTTVPGLAAPQGERSVPKLVYDFTEGNKDL